MACPVALRAEIHRDYAATAINGEDRTLSPGTYCGTLQIKKGTVTFAPGIYVIDGDDLNIQTHAKVSGKDVTFILSGTNPGVLDFSSGADVTFTAPPPTPMPAFSFLMTLKPPLIKAPIRFSEEPCKK